MRIALEGDDRQTLIARLGLSSDASDADITAAVTNRILASGGDNPPSQPAPAPGDTPNQPTAPATTPSGPQPAGPTQPGGGEGGGGGTADPSQPGNGGSAGSGPTSAGTATDDLPEDGVLLDPEAYRALTARAARSDQLEEDARITTRNTLVESAIRAGKFPPARRNHYRERYDSDPEATTAQIERMAANVVPVKERGVDVNEQELEASDAYPKEWVHGGQSQAQATPNGNGGDDRRSRIHTED
jgi:hypothetical protein